MPPDPAIRADRWWITLDQLPPELARAVAAAPAQRDAWAARFGASEPHPALPAATALLPADLRAKIQQIAASQPPDGLLIHSDNLAAMRWLAATGQGGFRCVYIDPPYNTGRDSFPYPDRFATDDWLAMMRARLTACRALAGPLGVLYVSIGREMMAHLHLLLDELFGAESALGELVWERGRKNDARYFSLGHEYVLVRAFDRSALERAGAAFREPKPGAAEILGAYRRLRDQHGSDHAAIEAGLQRFYRALPAGHPALKHRRYRRVDANGLWRDDNMSWPGGGGPRFTVMHPTTNQPCAIPPGGWRFATAEKFQLYADHGFIHFREDHTKPPMLKRYLNPVSTDFDPAARRRSGAGGQNVQVMPSVFYKGALGAVQQLRDVLGDDRFPNPKDPGVLARLIDYVGPSDQRVLDFFGGAGATAQAVIDLNRRDGGTRRFVLAERGDHFETTLLPRVLRAMHAPSWKAGRPTAAGAGGWRLRAVELART